MTGEELKTFVETGLLNDTEEINETFFYQLLNVAKEKIENERDWEILKDTDNSQTANVGDTFLTTKDLPSDFAIDLKVELTDENNHPLRYYPIPYSDRFTYKDASRLYYIDLANNKIGLTGKVDQARTIQLMYKKTSSEIASSTSWVFPSRFHTLLGFIVAEMWKAGSDYDDVNLRMAVQHRQDSKMMYQALLDWDTQLRNRQAGGTYQDFEHYDDDGLPMGDSRSFPLGLMGNTE